MVFVITNTFQCIRYSGFETARALAVHNAHVVMACRNLSAAEESKNKIMKENVKFNFTLAVTSFIILFFSFSLILK